MKVELFYFDECPNHKQTEQLLRQTISELGVKAEVELVKVSDNDDAANKKFLGSPSIRINGNDLEQNDVQETQYSMRCRMYQTTEGIKGIPPKELLKRKLQEAVG